MAKIKKDAYMGNPNLPTSDAEFEYTPERIREIKKCEKSILHFAENYFHIVNLDKGKQKIKLFKCQKDALKKAVESRFFILLASRQVGKSTLYTLFALWQACFQNDQRILLVANKEQTAIQLFKRVRMAYEELPGWLKPGVKEWGKTGMALANGSEIGITTTSGSAARGSTCNLLILDELAFIENHIVEEFWKSVYPVISSSKKSRILIASTPNGTDNLFYRLYKGSLDNSNNWGSMQILWNEIPGRDEQWKRDTIASLGSEEAFAQEFECHFTASGESAIDVELFNKLKTHVCRPMEILEEGKYAIWETPSEDKTYVVGVDVSEGIGQDASIAQIFDISDLRDIRQVAVYDNNSITPAEFSTKLKEILAHWGNPLVLIERNNCGGQVVDRLHESNYHNIVNYGSNAHRKNVMRGVVSHTNVKFKGVTNMRYWLSALKCVTLRSMKTLKELKYFVRQPNGSWCAQSGFHDDHVMSLVWALMILHDDVVERYFEIAEYDRNGKPQRLELLDYGIKYFENPTSIYNNTTTDNHTLPTLFGDGDPLEDDMTYLLSQGYVPLNTM